MDGLFLNYIYFFYSYFFFRHRHISQRSQKLYWTFHACLLSLLCTWRMYGAGMKKDKIIFHKLTILAFTSTPSQTSLQATTTGACTDIPDSPWRGGFCHNRSTIHLQSCSPSCSDRSWDLTPKKGNAVAFHLTAVMNQQNSYIIYLSK